MSVSRSSRKRKPSGSRENVRHWSCPLTGMNLREQPLVVLRPVYTGDLVATSCDFIAILVQFVRAKNVSARL